MGTSRDQQTVPNLMKIKSHFLLLFILCRPWAMEAQAVGERYSCLFYNVENLFHPGNDSLAADDEFTPGGSRSWTYSRYWKKIAQVCRVILAVNGWEPPDIVCLSEVENYRVLADIVRHPLLVHTEYRILHRDSPDHRGMDAAMLYRPERLSCIDTSWLATSDNNGRTEPTREIVCSTFLAGTDTLLVLANHWVSRYGGELETQHIRIRQAESLREYILLRIRSQPGLAVLAGGDLNEVSSSEAVKILTMDGLLSEKVPCGALASYKYQGKWEMIDHVFVGGKLASEYAGVTIPHIPGLLADDERHTGQRPARTYHGFRYEGGISDHLPLLVQFHLGPGLKASRPPNQAGPLP